tara:strand:+ start:379 stop:948 length:570 start_codon:yes stop_codon:yes gene_type:complete
MTSMIDYNDFNDFATKMNNTSDISEENLDAIKTLYECYSKYMVIKKYSNEYIKDMRMKSIINNYENYKCQCYDTADIIKYYKTNVVDNFDKKLDPPKCFFAAAAREKKLMEEQKQFEVDTDDIKHHYDAINAKYKYYNELSYKNNKDESDDEEYIDEYNYDYEYYTSSDSDDSYECYYSDNETDYMSDE